MKPEVLTVIGSVLVALISAWAMISAARKKTRSDVQASLNEGFTSLTAMLREEVASQRAEIAQLESHKRALMQRNETLMDFIKRHNLDASGDNPPLP